MTTTVSTKGQIVLPAEIRLQDNIEPGQEFEIERIDRGEYRLVRRKPPANEGLVDLLLVCPEKDFFVPIESESTGYAASEGITGTLQQDGDSARHSVVPSLALRISEPPPGDAKRRGRSRVSRAGRNT
jgi:AbrB family looped-hinge helix DNA binding protein